MSVKVYKKWIDRRLTIGLDSEEFRCKCTHVQCRALIVSDDLLESYKRFRLRIGKPLKITSGHRCTIHNYGVGGVSNSKHLAGQAIDISLDSFIGTSLDVVEGIAKDCGFKFVKFYDKFVHLDVRA